MGPHEPLHSLWALDEPHLTGLVQITAVFMSAAGESHQRTALGSAPPDHCALTFPHPLLRAAPWLPTTWMMSTSKDIATFKAPLGKLLKAKKINP